MAQDSAPPDVAFDVYAYTGAAPLPHGRDVARFGEFSRERQIDIALAVLDAERPPRWLEFGGAGKPLAVIESRAWYEWHWHRGIDPDAQRRPIPATTRARIISRDGYTCGICGGDVAVCDVHIDHIIPVVAGGSDRDENLRVTHSLCNLRKGGR